ncbi:MAG: efflux RND transporter periplasmic adaptor subunit [Brevinematales bacterium]|nr:efflux RND transporter periplasmic adaptor subunit [Brevinematales bacterium]
MKGNRILVAFIVLSALMSVTACGGKKDEGKKDNAVSVIVQKLQKGKLEQYLNLSGALEARDEVNIYPDVNGKIANITQLEGKFVYKGQAVMYVDRFQVGAEFALSPVKAPLSGYVTRIMVSVGQNVSPAVPVASVGNIDKIDILIYVPESKINEVQMGQKVYISVPAFPDKKFEGVIYRKDKSIDPLSHTLLVRASLDNKSKELLPGMYSDVSIFVRSADNVFVLPNSAIFKQGKEYFVYVNITNTAVLKKVEYLFEYMDQVAIKSGLNEGDELVVFGREFLKDGAAIKPIYEEELSKIDENGGAPNSTNQKSTNQPAQAVKPEK